MKRQRSRFLCVVLFCLCLGNPGAGKDLFTFRITVNGTSTVRNSNNDIRQILELFDNVTLGDIFPDYNPNSPVLALLNVRGLYALISYRENSSVLRLAVPSLGLDVRFPGRDREESQEWLEEWLKGLRTLADWATSAKLTDLLQGAVKYSPVDPVAGNPNSLQSQMFIADYGLATFGPHVSLDDYAEEERNPKNLFNLDIGYGGAFQGGPYDIDAISLQLGGLWNLPNRRWAIQLDWPTMLTLTEDAESIMSSLGLGLQYRICNWWRLTAFGRGGAAGSVKVGGLAAMYSATLTSYMRYDLGKVALGWGLMSGVVNTIDGIEIGDYDITYDLNNVPLRSGLDLSGKLAFKFLGLPVGWRVFGNYTYLFGTDLYVQDFSEVGGALRLVRERGGMEYDRLRLQFSYLFSEDYDGYSLKLGMSF